ncbi:unnamed protein product [Brachionus calyciflorus]|uniref:Protein kinase domain-containing protein n=1 Tax=Brachionus calyciflorus TaxID=104777 RepID=A0A813XR12_9BILA|nr:unnamed protein product [Brachionus calyciflorus]
MLPKYNIIEQIKEKPFTNLPEEGQYNSIFEPEIIQYKKKGIIGKGSFGIVFLAINHRHELIAVKQKKESKDVASTIISNLLFSEELESLSELNHPNIVRLLGVEFSFRGPISIVMEYLEGKNLENIIKTYICLPEMQIRNYTKQLVDAISYLHSKNIIHRDIKSTNVMISSENVIKLIDFGMAKKGYPSAYTTQSDSSSAIVGTLAYMAPEILSSESYNATVDVYSLGVLVFEMGYGEPFLGSKKSPIPLFKSTNLINLPNLTPMANNFMQNCLIENFKIRPRANTLKNHPFISSNY